MPAGFLAGSVQEASVLICPHPIADGGETRFHSVKNGLALVETPALVGVHDGVRPFVSSEVIRRCYAEASRKTGCSTG